jgi:tetratricopeptide (TPR) repeat protein
MRKIVLSMLFAFSVLFCKSQSQIDQINLLMLTSKYQEALSLCDEVIKQSPQNAHFYYVKAIICKQLFKYPDASLAIKQAISIEPENIDYLAEYASVLVKRNLKNDAIKVYKSVQEKNKYNVSSGLYLSNYYLKEREFEQAKDILLSLYEKDTTNSYFARNIGLCYIKLGKKDEALHWLSRTVKLDSTDVKAYELFSLVYSALEEFDLSLEYIEKAIKLDSLNKNLYIEAGNIHVLRNHNYLAIPKFLKAFEIDPNDESIARSLGFCYYKIKKNDKAKYYLNIAKIIGSMDLQIYLCLGGIYKQENSLDSSLFYYDEALKIIKPDYESFFAIYKNKAENHYYLNEFDKAIENYNMALDTDIEIFWGTYKKNEVRVDIAAIYAEKLNDKQKAIEYLEKVHKSTISLNKNYFDYAQQQINRLKEELFFEGKQNM